MNPNDLAIYWCPHTYGHYDPLLVRRQLFLQSDGRVNEWIADADTPATQEQLVSLVRSVFNLPGVDRLTGEGVPDSMILEVLESFNVWLLGKG